MDQSELYYQIARAKYQSQEGLNREFLTRASAIMTFGGALVAAAALVLNLGGLSQGNTVLGIFAALLACFVGVASCCVCILKPWWWSYGPQLPELQGHVLSTQFSDEQMAEWAGDVFQQSVEDNTRSPQMESLWTNSCYSLPTSGSWLVGRIVIGYLLRRAERCSLPGVPGGGAGVVGPLSRRGASRNGSG